MTTHDPEELFDVGARITLAGDDGTTTEAAVTAHRSEIDDATHRPRHMLLLTTDDEPALEQLAQVLCSEYVSLVDGGPTARFRVIATEPNDAVAPVSPAELVLGVDLEQLSPLP
jgi:hypothetical protein